MKYVYSKLKQLFKFNLRQRRICRIGALWPWPEDRHSVSSSPLEPSLLRAFRKNNKIKSSAICSYLLYRVSTAADTMSFYIRGHITILSTMSSFLTKQHCRVFGNILDDRKFLGKSHLGQCAMKQVLFSMQNNKKIDKLKADNMELGPLKMFSPVNICLLLDSPTNFTFKRPVSETLHNLAQFLLPLTINYTYSYKSLI